MTRESGLVRSELHSMARQESSHSSLKLPSRSSHFGSKHQNHINTK